MGLDGWGIAAAVLMSEWAFIHVIAGLGSGKFAFANDLAGWHMMLMEGVGKCKRKDDYANHAWPVLANRLPIQHSLNLFAVAIEAWIAVAAIVLESDCALLACVAPFLADVNYFIAIDIPNIGSPPGEAQTFIVSGAVFCAACSGRSRFPTWQFYAGTLLPIIFVVVASIRALGKISKKWPSWLDLDFLDGGVAPAAEMTA